MVVQELTKDVQSLSSTVRSLVETLHGKDGTFGFLTKVRIMWSSLIVWPLCTLSACVGAIGTMLITRWMK